MVWCEGCVGKSTSKHDTSSKVVDCHGCSKSFMRNQLTFPEAWKDKVGYCPICIAALGPHWQDILVGNNPARTKAPTELGKALSYLAENHPGELTKLRETTIDNAAHD